MNQSEKLKLWDRFFNRYRRLIIEEGREEWFHCPYGIMSIKSYRKFVKYKVIDRLTGSEKIELEYLS